MPVKLVVFDIAGTTVKDTDHSVSKAFRRALLQFGYDVRHEKVSPLMGYDKPLAIKMMLQQHEPDQSKITDELIKNIHAVFVTEMISHYQSAPGIEALPNVEQTFDKLQTLGISVCVNTGFSRDIAETIIRRLKWVEKGFVNHYIGSDEVEAGRPHPYMINKLMAESGIINAKDVVKVGDTEVDVHEGKNAGVLYSIGITTGAFTREELEKHNPDFIIDDMAELLPIIKPQI